MTSIIKMNKKRQYGLLKQRGILSLQFGKGYIALPYPDVMSEDATLDAIIKHKLNIGRFGDGELRLVRGGTAISQRFEKGLQHELKEMLTHKNNKCLVGIPNLYSETPKFLSWLKYGITEIVTLYKQNSYASSFITRPDSAPWIDYPMYWDKMRSLWQGRKVCLVNGSKKSLQREALEKDDAKVVTIECLRRDAYTDIRRIENEIVEANCEIAIMCLGATATVLAWRLVRRDVWAVDLGHVGMFMNTKGTFRLKLNDLTTKEYRKVLYETHQMYAEQGNPWGQTARKFVNEIVAYYKGLECDTMLDYGCGHKTLEKGIKALNLPIRVYHYDPGIPELNMLPIKPVDLVVCTDVMEHVEPQYVENVLNHIRGIAKKGVFFTIALAECKQSLSDGRNTHLTVRDFNWWLDKLKQRWDIARMQDNGKHAIYWGKAR